MGFLWWIVIVPVIDLILLSRLGRVAGGRWVFVWLLAAAVLGFLVIRIDGRRRRKDRGGILDRILVVLAGVLLIFPGPLSDLIALVILIPGVRQRIAERVHWRVFKGGGGPGGPDPFRGKAGGGGGAPPGASQPSAPGSDRARDVEFEVRERPAGPTSGS